MHSTGAAPAKIPQQTLPLQRTSQSSLTITQHVILLGMVRGETAKEIAARLGISVVYLSAILAKARRTMECRTLYHLLAVYVVFLMENEDAPLIESISVGVIAGVIAG